MFVGIDPDMGDVGFCKIHDPPDDIVKGSVARDTMYRGVWGIGAQSPRSMGLRR